MEIEGIDQEEEDYGDKREREGRVGIGRYEEGGKDEDEEE